MHTATATSAATPTGAPSHAERHRFTPPVGPIDGWLDGDLVRATGIRYATAGRFEKPRPVPDHTDTLDATTWSPTCPQNQSDDGDLLFSPLLRDLSVDEHCQYLSVTAPADVTPDSRLPVVVWIHGGSNVNGSGDSSLTDPGNLVREQRVVAVTVTYRLGALGYLGTDTRPQNLGLLDQAEALRWVRRNISAFGGDASTITALGESAGADAIAHLLAAFPNEPLMDRAILQSAPLGSRRSRDRLLPIVAKAISTVDDASTLDEILAVEEPILRSGLKPRAGTAGTMPFGVQYGHDPLPLEAEVEDAWRHVAPRVPILVTTMSHEFRLFTRGMPLVERVGRQGKASEAALMRLEEWGDRAVFTRGADELVELWRNAGGEALRCEIPWHAPGNPYGSAHGLDVLIQFGTRDIWEQARLVCGSRWENYVHAGTVLRAFIGAFAHGEDPGPGEQGVIERREEDCGTTADEG